MRDSLTPTPRGWIPAASYLPHPITGAAARPAAPDPQPPGCGETEGAETSGNDDPPRPAGEGDHPQDGGGVGTSAPRPGETAQPEHPSTPPVAPARSPSPSELGEDEEDDDTYDLQDWLWDHRDAIDALVAARQSPAEPEPPPPPPPPLPPIQVPYIPPDDRWTRAKMTEFLRQLAATHSVSAAAGAVGLSRQSAYKLRARLKGTPFDIAWEAAFRHGYDNLAHAALDRAINGVEVPHYHGGELVGTSRKYDERLTVALLAMRNRVGAPMLGRYNAAAEYWSEDWDRLLERVKTGSIGWEDEVRALEAEGRRDGDIRELIEDRDEKRLKSAIERTMPDEPRGRRR